MKKKKHLFQKNTMNTLNKEIIKPTFLFQAYTFLFFYGKTANPNKNLKMSEIQIKKS
jgi:hypothetical protein